MAESFEQLARGACGSGTVQHAAGGELVPEEDVLGDGQAVDDVELLVHRGDAHVDRGDGIRDLALLALPEDLAAGRLVRAGEDLDEGRLARAVLPEDAMHFARDDLEVDAAKGLDTGEFLRDSAHRE